MFGQVYFFSHKSGRIIAHSAIVILNKLIHLINLEL